MAPVLTAAPPPRGAAGAAGTGDRRPAGRSGRAGRPRRRLSLAARVRRDGLRWLTHAAAVVPFLQLLWDGEWNRLTVNPIQEITDRTGKTALIVLVISLACTPLNRTLGWRWTVPLRRPLGLWAFFYALLHFLTFAVVDYGLDYGLIKEAIVEKRYILAGFAAFVLLIPLAVTSTAGWMRRLGHRWKSLHRLVYLAAGLAVLHFVWLVKADVREPLLYGAAVGLLLLLRTPLARPLTGAVRRTAGRVSRLVRPTKRAPVLPVAQKLP